VDADGDLEGLIRRAMAEATAEADALVSRAERASERDLARARDNWGARQREAESSLAPALEARRRAALAEIAIQERRETMAYQEAAVDRVFQAALERLGTFSDARAHHDLLVRLIREAAERLAVPDIRVRLNATERQLCIEMGLPSPVGGAEVVLDEEVTVASGGPVVSDATGRLLYDNTFEARLERGREGLRAVAASALDFGAPGEPE